MQYVFYHWSLNHRALKWADNNGIELPLWHLQHFLRRYMPYFISIWLKLLLVSRNKKKMWQVGLHKIYEFGGMKLWRKHSVTTNVLKVFECVKKYSFLCNQLGQLLKCDRDKHAKALLEIDHKVVIALKLLTSSSEYRTLGKLFGTLEYSVCKTL